ncbi:recombinase family protein [Nonomuraea sp. NPDC001831]|uniref:recombinase family protein n=1 Tax=Nonomuraea sp. NPDC001831 TaxID=3364340 RepID=UPI0036C00AEE
MLSRRDPGAPPAGATMIRDGLEDLLRRVPPNAGHRITVVTLDRLGRNMREYLNLAHEPTERGPETAARLMLCNVWEPAST